MRARGSEREETDRERGGGVVDTDSDIDRKVTARTDENTFCAANATPTPTHRYQKTFFS